MREDSRAEGGSIPATRTVLVTTLVVVGTLLAAGAVALVVFAGDEAEPASGELIAYSCKERENPWYAICVMRVDGTQSRRLTTGLATTDPAWSPDGRRIAFTRNEELGESTGFTSDDVYVMAADGGAVERLTEERPGRSLGQPTWSPAGDRIAYVDGESVHSSVPSRYGALAVMDADGKNARHLTGGPENDPEWSPSGDAIVFSRGESLSSATESNDDIYVLDLVSGKVDQLTHTRPGLFEVAPTWSSDGTQIAFVRVTRTTQFDGRASIHTIGADGAGERLVLEHTLFASAPYSLAWSPDGRSLAFESSSEIGCTSISLVELTSGDVQRLTTCDRPSHATVAPAWQPDVTAKDR